MMITTIELPPDHIPMLRPTLGESAETFGHSLSLALDKCLTDPEMAKILGHFMSGRYCVFLTMHTEPSADLGGH